jgi:hypothetical protein
MSIRSERPVNNAPSGFPADLPAVGPPQPATGSEQARGARFAAVLQSVAARVDAGEALVSRAMRGGGGLEPGQWIALQAGIYRYVEAIDLAGKLVDRAGNAIRTVLQGGH